MTKNTVNKLKLHFWSTYVQGEAWSVGRVWKCSVLLHIFRNCCISCTNFHIRMFIIELRYIVDHWHARSTHFASPRWWTYCLLPSLGGTYLALTDKNIDTLGCRLSQMHLLTYSGKSKRCRRTPVKLLCCPDPLQQPPIFMATFGIHHNGCQ